MGGAVRVAVDYDAGWLFEGEEGGGRGLGFGVGVVGAGGGCGFGSGGGGSGGWWGVGFGGFFVVVVVGDLPGGDLVVVDGRDAAREERFSAPAGFDTVEEEEGAEEEEEAYGGEHAT